MVRGPEDYAFLPYQRRWIADRSPIRVGVKSRRIGLTWATALELVLAAGLSREAGGCSSKYTSYKREFTAEFIETCARWARALDLGFGLEGSREAFLRDDKAKLVYSIRFASGFKIDGVSSNPSNLRGGPDDRLAVIDEAAHLDDFAEHLKAADAFRVWGGRVLVISTHRGADSAFAKLIDKIKAGKYGAPSVSEVPSTVERFHVEQHHPDASSLFRSGPYSLHTTDIFTACDDGLYRRICRTARPPVTWSIAGEHEYIDSLLLGEGADEEYRCRPSKSGGAYFPLDLLDSCARAEAPVIRLNANREPIFEVPVDAGERELAAWAARRREWMDEWLAAHLDPVLGALHRYTPTYLGEDFGRVADLTVLCPLQLHPDMRRSVPFLVELRGVPFEQQRQALFHVLAKLPRFSGAALDDGGNGQELAEAAEYKYGGQRSDGKPGPIERVRLSAPWYAANFPPLKAELEAGRLTIPEDRDVRSDLRAVQVIDGTPRIPKARKKSTVDKGETRHGDAAVALVLAHYRSRTADPVGPAVYEAAGDSHRESARARSTRRRRGVWM